MYFWIHGLVLPGGAARPMLCTNATPSSVRSQKVADGAEIGPVLRHADVLEHADRNNTVKLAFGLAVISQTKRDTVTQPLALCPFSGIGMLFFRQGNTQH